MNLRSTHAVPFGAIVFSTSIIPPITDPLGKHWRQPDTDNFTLDDTHAMMSQRDFDDLAEYSTSTPSGVYPGKCWKSEELFVDRDQRWQRTGKWFLRWFGTCEDPKFVTNHHREIIII